MIRREGLHMKMIYVQGERKIVRVKEADISVWWGASGWRYPCSKLDII